MKILIFISLLASRNNVALVSSPHPRPRLGCGLDVESSSSFHLLLQYTGVVKGFFVTVNKKSRLVSSGFGSVVLLQYVLFCEFFCFPALFLFVVTDFLSRLINTDLLFSQ